MTEVPLDDLPAMPWPRWRRITLNLSDTGRITVALSAERHGESDVIYDSGVVDIAGRTLDSTGHENTFDG